MKSHFIHEISKNRREWREEEKEEKKKRKRREKEEKKEKEKKKRKKRKSRVRMMGRRAERRIERGYREVWEQTAKETDKGGHGKRGVWRRRRGGVKAYGRKKRGEDWRGMGKKWDNENVDASWP